MAAPEQVRLVVGVTPLLGEMETLVTTGAVLATVTEAESVSVRPAASVAVTVQVMVSPGWTWAGSSCTVWVALLSTEA